MTRGVSTEILAALISVFGTALCALGAWAVRTLWHLSASLQEERDAIRANTRAIEQLSAETRVNTTTLGTLSERVARLEGLNGR